jgi:hypothetical protein
MTETTVQHVVEITKTGQRRTSPDKLKNQIKTIINRAITNDRERKGWKIDTANEDWTTPRLSGGEYRWICKLNVTCTSKRRTPEAINQDFDNIIKFIGSAGAAPGWEVVLIDGKTVDANKDKRLPSTLNYVPVEIPDDWKDSFSHIYERESQIEIIMSCLQAGIDSDFNNRFHCALIGDPSCGKTETLRGVKAVVGKDSVLEYDATSTTQAGAIQDLNEREELPRILIVEEIEKADPEGLRYLLSLMDIRAEIRKITARNQIQKETRMLTLATVNDYPLFMKILYGSLQSRFCYHVYFPKPDKKLLIRILEREIAKANGKKAWIKPTIAYAESENLYDPRQLCAICLTGKDKLLSGEYQALLKKCAATNFLKEIHKRESEERRRKKD